MYVYICLAENEKLTKLNKCLHIFTLKCARTHIHEHTHIGESVLM